MIPVIALTQFAFTIIGSVSLLMLSRAQGASVPQGWKEFLAVHSLWMLLVPVAWMFFAGAIVRFRPGPGAEKFARVSGVIVAALLAGLYVWAIMTF